MSASALDRAQLARELDAGLAQLRLPLPAAARAALLDYLQLLVKWNRVYNLTAVRDPLRMVRLHLFDCLATVPLLPRSLRAGRVLDVGSGGGLPGVVWALCRDDLEVSCVDAVQKKAAFVQQVAGSLRLRNLHAVHARVEDLVGTWDLVGSRAFASLADFVGLTRHLLAPDGSWLAMKGKRPDAEIEALPADVAVFHVEHLTVPGLDAERCLVWMRSQPPSADGAAPGVVAGPGSG